MTNVKTQLQLNSKHKISLGLDDFRLKYKIDIIPLLLILSVFAVQISAFVICKDPISAGIVALALLIPQFMVSTIVHNQAHVAMFQGNIPNLIVNILLYLETGMMVAQFHLQHNCGHHCLYKDPAEDPATLVKADGSVMSRLEYVIRDIFTYTLDTIRIGKSYPRFLAQYYQQSFLNIILVGTLLLLNPINTLILFLIPILSMRRPFIASAYDDHVGLHAETDDYAASHSKTNPLINLFTFNNGYHLAHHIKPALHWSKLAQFHEEIDHKINVEEPYTFVNRIFK